MTAKNTKLNIERCDVKIQYDYNAYILKKIREMLFIAGFYSATKYVKQTIACFLRVRNL